MKRSGTVLIFVIVWAAVLFASFVIGICVREVRFHRARTVVEVTKETETTTPKPKVIPKVERLSETEKLAQELAQNAPAPRAGGGERMANRPGGPGIEAGQGAEGGRGNMRERMANMSDEERAQMEEQRRQMRERMDGMSEEEREAFRTQMRERMGGRRSGGDGEGGRGRPGGRQNREQQENN